MVYCRGLMQKQVLSTWIEHTCCHESAFPNFTKDLGVMRIVSRQTVKIVYDSWLHKVDIQQPELVQLFCQEAVGLVWLIIPDIAVLVVGRKPAQRP